VQTFGIKEKATQYNSTMQAKPIGDSPKCKVLVNQGHGTTGTLHKVTAFKSRGCN